MLTFNPDGHVRTGSRTLAEIIANDEYFDETENNEKEFEEDEEEKEPKKFKMMGFELDMTYPRTLKGFIRILQILLLVVSFICVVITWPSKAIYTFYCIVLVLSAIISSYLFFTILADSRGATLCGLSWIKLELSYFVFCGFIIFIGACLAASNSDGNPALNAGAAFGFLSVITFVACLIWSWKVYKNQNNDEDDKKDEEKDLEKNSDTRSNTGDKKSLSGHDQPGQIIQNTISQIDPPENELGDLRIDAPIHRRGQSGRFGQNEKRRTPNRGSLERPISVISRNEFTTSQSRKQHHRRSHRRQHSMSDKDSAYSEGSIIERDNRSLPKKIRRTNSERFNDQQNNREYQGPQRNQLASNRSFSERRRLNSMVNITPRYPQELDAASLNYNDRRTQKSLPNWIREALESDNASDHNNEPRPVPPKQRFPLLQMSDDESIAYPSVSQNYGKDEKFDPVWTSNQDPRAMHENVRQQAGKHRRCNKLHKPHEMHDTRRGQGRGRDKRFHKHGRRHHQGIPRRHHGAHHRGNIDGHGMRHGRFHNGHRVNMRGMGRKQPQEDFLRNMVGNDEIVNNHAPMHQPNNMYRSKNNPGLPMNGRGRGREHGNHVIPEQPSIHFPEQSRWDDNESMFLNN